MRLFVVLAVLAVAAGAGIFITLHSFHHFRDIERQFSGACTPVTGIAGPEDIDIDATRRRAFISSLDRRADDARGAIHLFNLDDPLSADGWRDITDGAPEAFRQLVATYRAPVYGYLVRCGVPEADRDDLFQEVFIRVHRAAEQYDPERPLHPWLFTVVANAVRSYFRKGRLHRLFSEPSAHEPADDAPDTERATAAKQTLRRLEQAIGQLPLPQREVVILSCIQNRPHKEIAEILALPVNTVKTHLRRARLRLAQSISDAATAAPGEVTS